MEKIQNKIRKLNLGCGKDIKKGYVNLDKSKLKGVDVAHDIDKYPWPFPSNYFDEVYGQDVIEHVSDLFKAMKEIHRISKNNAVVRLIVPYWHSSSAFYPGHHYYFNTDTMKLFTDPARTYDTFPGFKMEKIALQPSKLGWIIPPIPVPKSLFPNVIDLRHLVSYLIGEIVLKIDFTMRVVKRK